MKDYNKGIKLLDTWEVQAEGLDRHKLFEDRHIKYLISKDVAKEFARRAANTGNFSLVQIIKNGRIYSEMEF